MNNRDLAYSPIIHAYSADSSFHYNCIYFCCCIDTVGILCCVSLPAVLLSTDNTVYWGRNRHCATAWHWVELPPNNVPHVRATLPPWWLGTLASRGDDWYTCSPSMTSDWYRLISSLYYNVFLNQYRRHSVFSVCVSYVLRAAIPIGLLFLVI